MANKVYVILHGLITLVEDTVADTFLAFLIDMPDHRVAAGHWLTETTIPKGALLRLTNVQRDATVPVTAAKLDQTKNIIFGSGFGIGAAQANKRNQYRYAEIILPRPTRITSVNTVDIGSDLVPPVPANTKISDTQVFEYDVVAPTPSLVGDPSTPWQGFVFFEGLDVPSSTIHILNEPETGANQDHVKEEFQRSAELFRSALRLKTGVTPNPLSGTPTTVIPPLLPAVLHEETLPLSLRETRVFNMAAAARTNPPSGYNTAPGKGAVGGGLVCSGGHGT